MSPQSGAPRLLLAVPGVPGFQTLGFWVKEADCFPAHGVFGVNPSYELETSFDLDGLGPREWGGSGYRHRVEGGR